MNLKIMNKLFPIVLALMCFGFLLSVEQVTENHPNGMPKVIKTYKGSNKLELTKEIGYYSNGVKKYQATYHKGKIKDTQRWDENGIKQKDYYKFNGHQTLTRKADCEDAMGTWSKIYYTEKFYDWDGTEESCSYAGGIYTAAVASYGVEGDEEYYPPIEAHCYIESTSDEETCQEPDWSWLDKAGCEKAYGTWVEAVLDAPYTSDVDESLSARCSPWYPNNE